MPSKLQTYMQMADEAQRQITGSYRGWTGFLTTAARLYKYPYTEQVMIHAQRPDATACAEYDFWNEKMGRYVRRGSKGIALIDSSGDQAEASVCVRRVGYGRQRISPEPLPVGIPGGTRGRGKRHAGKPLRCGRERRACLTSLSASRLSLRRNTGGTISGISSPSLTIPFFTGMMSSTSEAAFSKAPPPSASPTRSCPAAGLKRRSLRA